MTSIDTSGNYAFPRTTPLAQRVAGAYGVKAPQQTAPTQQTAPVGRIGPATGPATGTQPATRPTTDPVAAPQSKADPVRVARLIGGVVPGKIDFSGDEPVQTGGINLYKHPADRNAAATGVELGRIVDLSG